MYDIKWATPPESFCNNFDWTKLKYYPIVRTVDSDFIEWLKGYLTAMGEMTFDSTEILDQMKLRGLIDD